jgi:protoheme ferro-lyase
MHAGGNVDHQLAIHAACFHDQHRVFTALAEAIREHAAGRAGAQDNVVVFGFHAQSIATVSRQVNP